MEVSNDRARGVSHAMMGTDPRPIEGLTMAEQMITAARRQNALDRVAELLGDWGSSDTQTRAVAILEAITAAGYRLPDVEPAAPFRGPGSTPAGRRRARIDLLTSLGWTREAAEAHVDATPQAVHA